VVTFAVSQLKTRCSIGNDLPIEMQTWRELKVNKPLFIVIAADTVKAVGIKNERRFNR
jgi:hypothetical protein